ncbi:hypothetical protein N9F76_01010 [bacterium]|jgi:hypothetical protein|nr:hypothetical protein [bacterium]
MKFILQPWQLMLIILAGWINRQQQEIIESPRLGLESSSPIRQGKCTEWNSENALLTVTWRIRLHRLSN